MSNFTFIHNVFYAICIFKSNISVVVRSFFEFGTVSRWCIMELGKKIWPNKWLLPMKSSSLSFIAPPDLFTVKVDFVACAPSNMAAWDNLEDFWAPALLDLAFFSSISLRRRLMVFTAMLR